MPSRTEKAIEKHGTMTGSTKAVTSFLAAAVTFVVVLQSDGRAGELSTTPGPHRALRHIGHGGSHPRWPSYPTE